jgi:hypothetical protein
MKVGSWDTNILSLLFSSLQSLESAIKWQETWWRKQAIGSIAFSSESCMNAPPNVGSSFCILHEVKDSNTPLVIFRFSNGIEWNVTD